MPAAGRPECAALDRPAWAPPDWLFTPVWLALYVTIAIAGWAWVTFATALTVAIWWLNR